METKANHVLIGAFVIAALCLAFGFSWWLGGIGNSVATARYQIHFAGSVRGLSAAADVLFNGLKIGRVESVGIDPADQRKVLVVVGVDPAIPVRLGAHAAITALGLTGLAAVQITPGVGSEPLVAMAGGIPEIDAELGVASNSLMEQGPELLKNANLAFTRLNDLLADNETSISKSVKGIETFSVMLQENSSDVSGFIRNARALSDEFEKVRGVLQTVSGTFDKLDGLISRNSANLDKTLINVASVSDVLGARKDDIAAIIGDIKSASGELKRIGPLLDGANDTFGRLNAVVQRNEQAIDKTVASVASFSGALDANKGDVVGVIKDAKEISEQLKRVGGKLEGTLDKIGSLIDSGDAASVMQQTREAVAAFRELAVRLEQGLGQQADGLARQAKNSMQEFDQFMRDGRKAAAVLDRVLEKVDRDPQSLLFGGTKVPEFNPNQ